MASRLGSPNKDKPFRDALRMELASAGDDHRALRQIAAATIAQAMTGESWAVKEIADRLDGKPAQAIMGDDDGPPIKQILELRWKASSTPST